MLFRTPTLTESQLSALKELDQLRERLVTRSTSNGRWMGTLRRLAKATSAESSTSIEGFSIPLDRALAIASGDKAGEDTESEAAVRCYAQAMDHVATMAIDPDFQFNDRVLLDLHFETCYFQRNVQAGLWRTGPVGITGGDGSVIYTAPESEQVPSLMAELVTELQTPSEANVVVRAAMAHLNLVSVHPFRDGNGRVARILQSLVLSVNGLLAPEFTSIEEYLAANTAAYYQALQEAHGPTYDPERSAAGWISFCINAHLEQAKDRLKLLELAAQRWNNIEKLVSEQDWPERFAIALEQALIGGTDRQMYASEADISLSAANGDFRRLTDSGLVTQAGKSRSTRYYASPQLQTLAVAAL